MPNKIDETIKNSIEGVLDKIVDLNPTWLRVHKDLINSFVAQAKSELHKMIEECVPKKISLADFDLSLKRTCDDYKFDRTIKLQIIAIYNSCSTQTLKNIEELFRKE